MVREIQQALEASPATVRRDLAELAGRGAVVRTHGGVFHPSALRGEPVFQQRDRVANAAKQAMAGCAALHVTENAKVFIDSGTSTMPVGMLLLARMDLTLFSNNLPLLYSGRDEGAKLISTGGQVRVPSQSLCGSLALSWMEHLRFDIAFIGASGLDPEEGVSVTSLEEAAMKQAAIRRSRKTVLVADAQKWEQPAAILFAAWNEFDVWVTDTPLTKAQYAKLKAHGISVELVGDKA